MPRLDFRNKNKILIEGLLCSFLNKYTTIDPLTTEGYNPIGIAFSKIGGGPQMHWHPIKIWIYGLKVGRKHLTASHNHLLRTRQRHSHTQKPVQKMFLSRRYIWDPIELILCVLKIKKKKTIYEKLK